MKIDLSLVSTYRPELLSRTLESFQSKILKNFEVCDVFVNLDPAMGDHADGKECVKIIYKYFPQANVRRPETPSFGAAVKHTWSQMKDRVCLHLEDDWIVLEDVYPEMVLPLFEGKTAAVFLSPHYKKRGSSILEKKKTKIKFMGLVVNLRYLNGFGTGPRFLAPNMARNFGELIDASKDPEKQVLRGVNKALCRLQEKYLCKGLWIDDNKPVIKDIGRDFRLERGIEKINFSNGDVVWQ